MPLFSSAQKILLEPPSYAAAMSFTKPYLKNAQVLVVRADSNVKTLADLKGKTIGLQAGSSAADALEAAKEFSGIVVGCSNQVVVGTPPRNIEVMLETLRDHR